MLETAIALLFAHLAAHFAAQTRRMTAGKCRIPLCVLQIFYVVLFLVLFLRTVSGDAWAAVALVVVSHAVLEAWKIRPRPEPPAAAAPFGPLQVFAINQIGHLLFIGLAVCSGGIPLRRAYGPYYCRRRMLG